MEREHHKNETELYMLKLCLLLHENFVQINQ